MRTMRRIRIIGKHAILGVIAFIGIIPFLLLFLTSIKDRRISVTPTPVWLFRPTLENYKELVRGVGFLRSTINSIFIAGSSTIITALIGILSGYAFSRYKFRASMIISNSILFLKMVPPIIFIIPYFLMWRFLHLADTYLSIILMYVFGSMPMMVWMLRSFFIEIPSEIEEAALVDGCSRWQALRLVLVPAIIPGIIASSTLIFIFLWNEFMFALFNTGKVTRTMPVEIYNSIGFYHINWSGLSSHSVIAVLPGIIFIIFTQKYIVRGLTMGAVKE